MRDRHITLYIPGLFGSDAWSGPEVFTGLLIADLGLMLCRGRRRQRVTQSTEGLLFELLAHAAEAGFLSVLR